MPTLPAGVALAAATPGRGRSMVATRAFGPGDTIATFAEPCISIPDSTHLENTCTYCFAFKPRSHSELDEASEGPPSRMSACARCRTAHYCSTTCQRADWEMGHRRECKALLRARQASMARAAEGGGGENGPTELPTLTRALIQILSRPDIKASVADLEGHFDSLHSRDPEARADIELEALAALHYLKLDAGPADLSETASIICKLEVNAFSRKDEDYDEGGFYVNAALAMINHSCVPNADVKFVGRRAVLYAYGAIKEGEEITISYIETTGPRSYRQSALKERYHFDCACPRCVDDLDVYEVCQRSPYLALNARFSLADPDALHNPPVDSEQSPQEQQSLKRHIDDIYATCSMPMEPMPNAAAAASELRQRWRACAPLRRARRFAMDPLPQIIVDSVWYFVSSGRPADGLAVACFIALRCDPYRMPLPFGTPRLKGMLLVARMLTQVVEPGAGRSVFVGKALHGMDLVTMYQVVLHLIRHHGATAHPKEYPLCQQVGRQLDELESLASRRIANALVGAFMKDPDGPGEARFFRTVVLEPLRKLADSAMPILEAEFGA
ncbi:hypothetical protein GGR52DRAFT_319014 [Hypoxylon sp. FL1284]|nr:hypothetical protein GGR52DRAFT_319014 [Hypoxylon sp. FL1284]